MASPQPTPPPVVAPPILPAPVAREVVFDEAGRIAEDLPCLRCGYNLRGLGSEATCPECASTVGRSIQGDLLRFCDPDWLARLAKGLLLIIIGLLAGFVPSLLVFALMVGGMPMGALVMGSTLLGVATSLVVVIGVWWMTAPDPARTEAERLGTARTVARWCITAELLSGPLAMMRTTAMMTMPQSFRMLPNLIVSIVVLVGYLAGLVYLRRLALRIPRPGLAQQTKIVMWGYGSAKAATIGLWIALVVVARTAAFGMTMVVKNISYAVWLATLVFIIWGLVLLFLYRGALSRAEAEARATWTRK